MRESFSAAGFIYTPHEFSDLIGWQTDAQADAQIAFARSADRLRGSGALAAFPEAAWRQSCDALTRLGPRPSDAMVRNCCEETFQPVLIEDYDRALFTGYFEPILEGSRERFGPYQTPLYRLPPNRRVSRRQIHGGALADRGLELVWVADPVEAFFLEIQGSGRVRFPDGSMMRVGYAGQNGHRYVAIGRILIDEGHILREDMSAEAIKAWIRANPEAGLELMLRNPSYVYFRQLDLDPRLGPLGALEVPLTDLRSVAVDRSVQPMGAAIWVETTLAGEPFHRLMVAQDVGGAIKGAQRADIYCGSGDVAGLLASAQAAPGRMMTLVPRQALAAWVGSGEGITPGRALQQTATIPFPGT